jgi:hypothetical protein
MFNEVNNAYQLLIAYNQQKRINRFGRIRIDLSPEGIHNAMITLSITDPNDLATINERWNYLRQRYGPGGFLYNQNNHQFINDQFMDDQIIDNQLIVNHDSNQTKLAIQTLCFEDIKNDICVICMLPLVINQEMYIDDCVVSLNCYGHQYHKKCISEWFETKLICPLCNTQFNL